MSPGKLVVLSVIGVIILTFGGCGLYGLGCINQEVDLRTAIQAKSTSNEATLDTMWKVISQKAQISEKAVSDITSMNKIYEELVQGRSGGALFKMVSENYPNLGQAEVTKLYSNLMGSVEAERKTFKRDQLQLQDLIAQRKALIERPVSGFWVKSFGNATPFLKKGVASETHPVNFKYTWVTSKSTKRMVESGEEDIGRGPGLFKSEGK